MSYILDALRKSEDERRAKQPLALPESGSDLTYRRNNRAPWLLVALMIAGAAILYMVAKGWGPGYSEPEPAIAKVEPDPATQRVEHDKPHLVAGHRLPKPATAVNSSPGPQADAEPEEIPHAPEPKGTSTPLRQTAVQQVEQDKPHLVAGHPIPKPATAANSSPGPQTDAEPEEIPHAPEPKGTSTPLRQIAVQQVEQDKPHLVAGHPIPKPATAANSSPGPQTDAEPEEIPHAPEPKGTSTPLRQIAVQQVAQDKPHVVAGHPIPKPATAANSSPGPQTDAEPEEIPHAPEPKRTSATLRQTALPEQSNQHTAEVENAVPEERTSTRETTQNRSSSPPKQAFVDAVRAQTEPSRTRTRPRTKTLARATVPKRAKVQPHPKPRPTRPAKPTPTVVAVAEPVTPPAPARRGLDPLPLLAAMPPEFQRRMPEMNVNVHFYSEDPGSRFVVINMTRYRPGERIADGPLLEAIIPDGLILQSGKKRFRMERR